MSRKLTAAEDSYALAVLRLIFGAVFFAHGFFLLMAKGAGAVSADRQLSMTPQGAK